MGIRRCFAIHGVPFHSWYESKSAEKGVHGWNVSTKLRMHLELESTVTLDRIKNIPSWVVEDEYEQMNAGGEPHALQSGSCGRDRIWSAHVAAAPCQIRKAARLSSSNVVDYPLHRSAEQNTLN